MNMSEIVKDAIRYPFSDWKKILILGIIILINSLVNKIHDSIIFLLIVFIIYFLLQGYEFKIIKSSLNGLAELPKFNDWVVQKWYKNVYS